MNKIDIEKGFLENLDYLKQLVKLINAKPISEFDKNLTYEVIYADAYVESIIPQIEDTKLVATLGDIKTVLDLVVSEIPIDEVNRQRKSKDYENLVKLKYSDDSGVVLKRMFLMSQWIHQLSFILKEDFFLLLL